MYIDEELTNGRKEREYEIIQNEWEEIMLSLIHI